MDPQFVKTFFTAYPYSSNSLYFLLIVGSISFYYLPKEKKSNILYWLPFLILCFTSFYEIFGRYTNYNYEFKRAVNEYLGNYKYPKFNLWLFNVARRQIGTILFLLLIRTWLKPSKKKIINWMILAFFILALGLQIFGIEPIYLHQPIIFSIGANMILIGCAMYFIELITEESYISKNPLRLLSFWQMTFIMFSFSLSYISSVALLYLYEVDPALGNYLQNIEILMNILTLAVLTLTIASPLLPRIFEKESYYEPYRRSDLRHHI